MKYVLDASVAVASLRLGDAPFCAIAMGRRTHFDPMSRVTPHRLRICRRS
jgi:hypothetical protein